MSKNKQTCSHDIKIGQVKTRLEGNLLIIDYDAYSCDSSFTSKVRINYCPMCGEKLAEKKELD